MTIPGDHSALLRALLASGSEILLVLDTDGRCRWVSPSIGSVLGYEVDEVTGHLGTDFIHPDDASRAIEQLRWVSKEPGRCKTATWRVLHADGSWLWVEAYTKNLTADPDVGGIVAGLHDITSHRRTEDALRESEERFRAVIQNSRDVTGILAPDASIIWASPNAGALFGHAPEDLVGMQGFDFVHPDDQAAAMERMSEGLESEVPADPIQIRIQHAEGFWTPVEIAGSALRDPDGDVEGLIVNLRDVSWRVGAEQALRDSEERFRALVQNSSDVVMVIDATFEVTYVSPSVEGTFGYQPDDLIGDKGVATIHPDDLPRIQAHFEGEAAEPGSTTSLAYRALDAHGRVRWVEATITNLLDEPGVQGMVVNARDVTDRVDAERALRESEVMFRSLTESSPVGIYTVDAEGHCLYINDRYLEIMGLTREQALGHGWANAIHPDDLTWLLTDVGNLAFEETRELTYRVVHPDGAVRWITVHTSPIAELPEVRSVGVVQDITDEVLAQRDTERLTDIFEATHDLVGITDADGRIQYLNRAARQFFGLRSSRDLAELGLSDIFAPWAVEQLSYEVEPLVEREGFWDGELALTRPDGTEVPVLAQLLAHRGRTGQLEFFSIVVRDISERKAFEHELAHQATHDPLTGLPNRVLLLDELDKALARARRHGRPLAVLFIDLDHFKVVNDSLGHGVGDQLLVAIADRLRLAIRPGDTIARFGGDEFVLMCEDLESIDDAVTIAKRVEHSVMGPFDLQDGEVYVGVSIGIAVSQAQDESETLIRDADAAMYRAKAKGRGRFEVFDSAMRAHAVDRLEIENALRRAIERREMRVFYQPIIDLGTGRIVGLEALLRWEHPHRGLLEPVEFITISEETGLIVPVGGWALAQACRQLQRWEAEFPETSGLNLTVNLSGRQLAYSKIVTDVDEVLTETGIDPARLDLEITESVLMDDVVTSAETLQQLKGLGVRLAVDDFGTGYSSLSYLRQFPVDVMKVDRSFVDGLGEDPSDSAIVAAIVRLAHTLGLEAVAEGVETPEQLQELRELGCDRAQGFYMARPLPPDGVLELILQDPEF